MNWESYYSHWAMPIWGFWFFPIIGALIFIAAVWSVIWKGMALWRAARIGDKRWFVILLIVNTLGILEILYLYVFSKKSDKTGRQ